MAHGVDNYLSKEDREENAVAQSEEVEALEAIYGDDIQVVDRDSAAPSSWQVVDAPVCMHDVCCCSVLHCLLSVQVSIVRLDYRIFFTSPSTLLPDGQRTYIVRRVDLPASASCILEYFNICRRTQP